MITKETFLNDKKTLKTPLTHIVEDVIPELRDVDEIYGAADVLSIENAQKHQKILFLLSLAGTLLTIFFLLYDEAELYGLIFACIIMIITLFLINRFADNLDCHKKYLEYRVLAENMRVHYFLMIAGVNRHIAKIMPWYIKSSIPWIEEIINGLPEIQLNEKQSILECWIHDQKSYHESALEKSKARKIRDDRTTKIVIVITVAAYIVAMLFEIYMFNSTPNVDANAIRAVLKIVLGTLSAITLFTGSYYGKMSLPNIIDDHRRMIILYDAAEKEIEINGETEELIVFLAREFLTENSAWYAYQSKNKPDIVI